MFSLLTNTFLIVCLQGIQILYFTTCNKFQHLMSIPVPICLKLEKPVCINFGIVNFPVQTPVVMEIFLICQSVKTLDSESVLYRLRIDKPVQILSVWVFLSLGNQSGYFIPVYYSPVVLR